MSNDHKSVKRVEGRQTKLAENAAAAERWASKLFRAARELQWLRDQRKRLLKPKAVFEPEPPPKTKQEMARERKRERDRASRARRKAARIDSGGGLGLV